MLPFDVSIFRQHQLAIAAYCYRRSSAVCMCVCLCVGHVREPCKDGWTDRDAVWGLMWSRRTMY